MKYSTYELCDLPDEILMIILKQLNNAEALYCLIGVNKRLNQILHDQIFTSDLSLMIGLSDRRIYPVADPIFTNHLSLMSGLLNRRIYPVVDPIFTSHLSLMSGLSYRRIYPLPDPILDRFCSQVLPEVHDKIRWLYLESSSMKRILLSTNYPNLYGLALFAIEEETAIHLFTGKLFYFDFFGDKYIEIINQKNFIFI
jgi:hypothetical protein